jgi:hypothetical protein
MVKKAMFESARLATRISMDCAKKGDHNMGDQADIMARI